MPKRRRWNRMLWVPLLAIGAAIAIYVFGGAWLLSRNRYPSFDQLLIPRCVDVLVFGWLFWVSSAIGSFLNVVAYRLPLGRGVGGFSACPFCNTPILGRDNVPVFGWLSLRGRCRACRLPIAARYPLVELSVGLTMTAVGIMELYLAGWNLPYPLQTQGHFGPLHMPNIWTEGFALGLYHMLSLAAIWAVALVRIDGVRLPRNLVIIAFLIVTLPMLVWPPFQVVSWQVSVPPSWRASGYLSAVLRVVTGFMAAAVLGRAIGQSMFPGADIKLDPLGKGTARLLDLIAMLSLAGIVVGWQAIVGVTIIACGLAIVLRRFFPTRDGLARLAIAIPPALTIQLVGWRWIDAARYWPSTHAEPWVMIGGFFVILLLALWLKPTIASELAAETGQLRENDQSEIETEDLW